MARKTDPRFRLAQDSRYGGGDWWEWRVWLDASDEDLDKVRWVEYTLHATFPKPVRRIDDRATKFELRSGGWGIFTIYALVELKSGETIKLEHDLKLYYPDGTSTQA